MGDVSYRPIIDDMVWSYSRIKSFEDCPYKWFCHYIRGENERPMFYASYGSYVHDLLRRYYIGEIGKDELPMRFLLDFSTKVQGERPASSTVAKYIQSGHEYFKNFEPLPYRVVDIEKEVHFDLDGTPFVAFIDFIGEKDGKLMIVDHKSRELKPRSSKKKKTLKDIELDEMLRQLYLYSHGIKQLTGEFPAFLCINSFRNGNLIEEPFDRTAYESSVEWAKQKIEEISDEEEFRPYVDFFQCKYLCGLHDECCYWNGG